MSFWSKLDKILTRVEEKGFRAANKMHQYAVNALIMGFLYGTYTLFRDYNDFFIDAREITPESLGPLPDPVSDEQINATSSTKLNNNLGGSRKF
ncbi:hypothetical protein ABPG74_018716 [Tetrahymena malaccensis]